MDIAALSVLMSQSSVQQAAGVAVTKLAMNTEQESAANMTEMIGNCAVNPNLGNHLDVRA